MTLNDIDPNMSGEDAKAAAQKPGADAPAREVGAPNKSRRPKRQNNSGPAVTDTARAAGGKQKVTKSDSVLKLLRSSKGTTVAAMMEATGWQAHSVRGFLSGTVRKKMELAIASETGKDGVRRYRITQDAAKAG
jgi:hypothetical protein